MYSRLAYFAFKQETTENTAVKPDTFFGLSNFDLVTKYGSTPTSAILGVRNMQVNPVPFAIEAPQGTATIQIEPKKFGSFMKAVMGTVTSGRYMPISSVTGTFVVGETITGGTSAATAVILAVSAENDYLLLGTPTGTFTVTGEAITGGTSSATATAGVNAATVYGHEGKAPYNTSPTFTVEVGLENEAYRFTGVRFPAFNSFTSSDNVMTAELAIFARAEFKHARVTAAVTSGAGAKVIPLDQTLGLVAADTVKVYRPGTGFLDFSAASTKTHTIGSITADASISVTNLDTALAVGDLLVLAPQTASYTVGTEFAYIGATTIKLGNTITAALAATAAGIEEFEIAIVNEVEARHKANGFTMANRFPAVNHLKGFTGTGKVKRAYEDMTLMDRMRNQTDTALQLVTRGKVIGSTNMYNTVDIRLARLIFEAYNPAISEDAVLDEDISFSLFRESSAGYTAKMLVINDVATV